jgi:hypothetical protein
MVSLLVEMVGAAAPRLILLNGLVAIQSAALKSGTDQTVLFFKVRHHFVGPLMTAQSHDFLTFDCGDVNAVGGGTRAFVNVLAHLSFSL